MTKVRVSEETFNLSHSSNLISAIGLERLLTYLMRSIRVRGRTHSWVVHAFLLREQEEKREVELREERQHLQEESTHPKANNRHGLRGNRQHLLSVRTVRI
jgi:hypothetical protein